MTAPDKSVMKLIMMALDAPPGTERVTADDGREAVITHDAAADCRRVEFPGAPDAVVRRVWACEATAARPELYPVDVPFVPELSCFVHEQSRSRMVVWPRDWGIFEDRIKDIKDMATKLPMEELLPQFGSKMLAPANEQRARKLQNALQSMVEEGVRDGWNVEIDELRDAPLPGRSVVLVRQGERRNITYGTMFGMSFMLLHDKLDEATNA